MSRFTLCTPASVTALCMKCTMALCLVLSLASCDDVSCPLNNKVESIYNFYASARDADGVFHPGASVGVGDTITITATGTDEVIVNKKYSVSTLSMQMSYYADADTLIWTFTDAEGRMGRDTIYINKTNSYHFDDPSCPANMWHHIDSVRFTCNLIDTIIVANADVNYDGLENFQIYFRTSDDTDSTSGDADSTSGDATSTGTDGSVTDGASS